MIQKSTDSVGGVESSGPEHVQSGGEGEPESCDGHGSFAQWVTVWTVVLDQEVGLGEGFEFHWFLRCYVEDKLIFINDVDWLIGRVNKLLVR